MGRRNAARRRSPLQAATGRAGLHRGIPTRLAQYRRLPDSAEASVARLYQAGLPEDVMVDAAQVAASQRGVYDRFSYFMGICWRRVTEIQDTAKQILAADNDPGAV